jgi:hypothetical protein
MGKVNPKADGKYYKGSIGPPHVLELLYAKHIEKEENCALKKATGARVAYKVRTFGPGGSIVQKKVELKKEPKALTDEEKRAKKINKAVLHVLRKQGFGSVRKDLQELQRLRKEQDNSIDQVQKAIPRLSTSLRRLA